MNIRTLESIVLTIVSISMVLVPITVSMTWQDFSSNISTMISIQEQILFMIKAYSQWSINPNLQTPMVMKKATWMTMDSFISHKTAWTKLVTSTSISMAAWNLQPYGEVFGQDKQEYLNMLLAKTSLLSIQTAEMRDIIHFNTAGMQDGLSVKLPKSLLSKILFSLFSIATCSLATAILPPDFKL